MKKLSSIITICCLLMICTVTVWSCKKKDIQIPNTPSISQTDTQTPAATKTSSEPESIKTLQGLALKNFDEQMKAYFEETPDKDAKIKVFEDSMDLLAKEYYRYYVEETKEGINKAKANFTAFLTSFKSSDGVGLSKDSIPFYLEKMKK
jgi:hypothetical protein